MTHAERALRTWFRADAALMTLTNGLYPEPAPPRDAGGPALPFVTYNLTGVSPDNAIRQYVDNILLTFYIRGASVSPMDVDDIYAALTASLDRAPIPVVGHSTVRFDRVAGGGRTKDADGGWVFVVPYNWQLQVGG